LSRGGEVGVEAITRSLSGTPMPGGFPLPKQGSGVWVMPEFVTSPTPVRPNAEAEPVDKKLRRGGGGEDIKKDSSPLSRTASQEGKIKQADDSLLVMQMLLHAADLGNVTKDWNIHVQWSHHVLAEFYSQGDLEKHLGKPVSPHCVRDIHQGRTNQKLFLIHCVMPLYQLGMQTVPRGRKHFESCITQMRSNAQRWEDLGY